MRAAGRGTLAALALLGALAGTALPGRRRAPALRPAFEETR